MKKILSLIIAILLMMSIMVSCELTKNNDKPQSSDGTTTQQQDDTSKRPNDDTPSRPNDEDSSNPGEDSSNPGEDDSNPGGGDDVTVLPEDGSALTIPAFNAVALVQPDKGATTTQKYLVTGTITEIKSTQYGNMYIEDADGNTLYIYGVYNEDGTVRFDKMDPQPKVGDVITVLGVACNYNGAQMKNGWVQLIGSDEGGDNDGDNDTDIPGGEQPDSKLPVEGVAYKLFMTQKTLDKVLYAAAVQSNNKYITGVENSADGFDFYAEIVTGGYKFYTTIGGVKMYLNAELILEDGNTNPSKYLNYAEESEAVWYYQESLNAWFVMIDGAEYVLGTYKDFNTFCISESRYITEENTGVTQFPGNFLAAGAELPDQPGDNNPDGDEDAPSGIVIGIPAFNEIAAAQPDQGDVTVEKYLVTGVITEIVNAEYGNMYIQDADGNTLYIYGVYNADGTVRFDAMNPQPAVGDTIAVLGSASNYNGAQMKSGWVQNLVPGTGGGESGGDQTDLPTDGSTLTIPEFNAIAAAQPNKGAATTQKYFITGTITEIANLEYGNMYIQDADGNTLFIYGVYSMDGETRFDAMNPQPAVGDTITVLGAASNYNGAQMKNGWVQEIISGDGEDDGSGKLYTDFTADEKQAFLELFGEVIPFVSNNEYYVDEYSDTDLGMAGFNFYAFGNTQAEFDAYLQAFSSYTFVESYEDYEGDTWYVYQKGDFYVDLAYYYYDWEDDSGYLIDVYIYYLTDDSGDGETGGGDGEDDGSGKLYTDFTADEKQAFLELFGEVIPFVSNNEYYVDEYSDTDLGMAGFNFYAYDNTQAEFDAYLQAFSSYTFVESYEDSYGDTWYVYQKGDFYVDLSYYYYDSANVIDVYIYYLTDGGESGGGSGSGSGTATPDTLITNDGKGLPTGTNGVYEVCFDDAIYVKDVTEQSYYMDGCPTTGSPAVLVIPVDFTDFDAETLGYDINVIKRAFLQNGVTDYHSVYDYYYTSSYGQLTLDITVLDFWFTPQYDSEYYANATADYFGTEYAAGDQMIINEALAYLDTVKGMDLSKFDSDGNGTIDSIVIINSLEIGEDTFHWAYRYWNLYGDENDEYYEYDGVYANDYLWASYQFMHESYDAEGNVTYDDTSVLNTYTYIHEFGHVLGADDYYDTAYVGSPMGGCDIMDAMTGDHNAYTKFNLGWIDTSRLVTTDSSVTLTLEDFSQNGDTIILANNWDPSLGAYQEYYIVVYYRNTGLNAGDDAGYFSRDGIIVYHVNASLYSEEDESGIYYDVYFNNTDPSDSYGTSENLIEFVKHPDGEDEIFTYVAGDSLPTVTDDSGNTLGYTFTVDSLEDGTATLTFTKLAA